MPLRVGVAVHGQMNLAHPFPRGLYFKCVYVFWTLTVNVNYANIVILLKRKNIFIVTN